MPEWSNGTVLKTVVGKLTVGSNPTLSATFIVPPSETCSRNQASLHP
jgi:hypothetical protein